MCSVGFSSTTTESANFPGARASTQISAMFAWRAVSSPVSVNTRRLAKIYFREARLGEPSRHLGRFRAQHMNCGHFLIVRQDAPLFIRSGQFSFPVGRGPSSITASECGASPGDSQFSGNILKPPPNDNPVLSLFTAIQEQLGFKLEPTCQCRDRRGPKSSV